VSVVLDGVGGAQGRAAMDLLRPGGRMLLFGYSSGEATPLATSNVIRLGITVSWPSAPASGRMRELETRSLAEAAAGRLIPVVGQRVALTEAADGHRAIEARETVGTTVLVP
jgi:NADPH:quinone reductase